MGRPPTIKDVAREAGVGVGTVSRVLNNNERVSPETRERVMAAITALGFRPNKMARSLPSGTRTRSIGVVLPYLTHYPFVGRLRGVQTAIDEQAEPYELILHSVNSPERYAEQLASIAHQRSVDGLLIIALNVTPEQRTLLHDAGIVFVGINDRPDALYPCIGPANVTGGRLATEYLISLGHRDIAYIGDSFPDAYNFHTSEDRYQGFCEALTAHGLSPRPEFVQLGPHGQDIAQALAAELLSRPTLPTAIFAMSDVQALGCLAAIRQAGLRVPNDISLMGFDDIELSNYIGLTTVRQHLETSGYLAMRYLLDLLDGQADRPPHLPDLEVIVRETTGVPRLGHIEGRH